MTNPEEQTQISNQPSTSENLTPSQLASLPFTRKDLHILAIDDDPMLLKSITKALTDLGYHVTTATNGAEGLEYLNSGKQVDLILSDVMMPQMNGPQFLTAARSDPRFADIPIVMMSSNDQYEIVFDCLSKGADDYMIKPLPKQVLQNIYANVWLKRKQNAAAQKIQHQIVEASVITAKIENMKKSFSENVHTPVKDAIGTLRRIIQSGGVTPTAVDEVKNIINKLVHLNDGETQIGPKPQIPTKMQDFFQSNFGVGSSKPSSRVITPVALTTKRKQAPAVEVQHLEPLNLGDKLFSFEFNAWNICEHLLMNLANDIFTAANVKSTINAKDDNVEHFIRRSMQGFRPNPFHNFRRACDSLQFVATALKKIESATYPLPVDANGQTNHDGTLFTPYEKLGCLLAALLHDIDHPGTNNLFQIKTQSQMALTYNDRKVLENNSASKGSIVIQDCFSFSINDQQFASARQIFIRCVLRTDLASSQKFMGKVLGVADHIDFNRPEHRSLALEMLVLMGDLAFAIRPWEVATYWYSMMRDEQLQQGDTERRLGLPVAPLMDRGQRNQKQNANIIMWHFNEIVTKIFQTGLKLFPQFENELLEVISQNQTAANVAAQKQ